MSPCFRVGSVSQVPTETKCWYGLRSRRVLSDPVLIPVHLMHGGPQWPQVHGRIRTPRPNDRFLAVVPPTRDARQQNTIPLEQVLPRSHLNSSCSQIEVAISGPQLLVAS